MTGWARTVLAESSRWGVDCEKKGGIHAASRNPSRQASSTQVPWCFRAPNRRFERPLPPGPLATQNLFSTAPDQPDAPGQKRVHADQPGVLSRIRVARIYKILFNQLLGIFMKAHLVPRKDLLEKLGHTARASRASWSHDLGDAIVFDAWENQWTRNAQSNLVKYPLRTNGHAYNPAEAHKNPSHKRWQKHVDLVLAGKRSSRAILPVARGPLSKTGGAKGWLPLVVDGHVETDGNGQVWLHADQITSADQIVSDLLSKQSLAVIAELMEGALHRVVSSQYERNPAARLACIEHYGANCFVCGFSFEATYGELGHGFIHVHHLVPVSSIGKEYQVNPIEDLRPVCPNCHAMLHRKDPPFAVEDLQSLISGESNA